MTCSITDCLADILKLEVTYPPGRSDLAKIVACFPICRVQEAFKENIISAPDSVWRSTRVCVCVCAEQVMENEEGREGPLSPMPESKFLNDLCRTGNPVEKLNNWEINRAESCMGSSLSLGFQTHNSSQGLTNRNAWLVKEVTVGGSSLRTNVTLKLVKTYSV